MSDTPQYCNLCKRNVTPTKDFNWLLFIFLCGCFYLPFYFMKEKTCPICKGANFGPAKADEIGASPAGNSSINVSVSSTPPAAVQNTPEVQRTAQGETTAFCPKCGTAVEADSAFCGECGAKL